MVERNTQLTCTKLSAYREIFRVEPLKFGETLTGKADGNPERSLSEKSDLNV